MDSKFFFLLSAVFLVMGVSNVRSCEPQLLLHIIIHILHVLLEIVTGSGQYSVFSDGYIVLFA